MCGLAVLEKNTLACQQKQTKPKLYGYEFSNGTLFSTLTVIRAGQAYKSAQRISTHCIPE